jgi:DNA primase catalytic subunit
MIVKAHFNHKSDYQSLENKIADILKNTKIDSITKWNYLYKELLLSEKETQKDKNYKKTGKYTTTELCLKEIKLNVLFPRLDINVSKHINHLLKSPFCVHPKTGLISVPLNENDIVNFNLEMIPSITDSIDEFHENK